MTKVKGCISDIIPFSLHDGPGIRTTVFLKGCPLRCMWCHNPETQMKKPINLYSADKCVHCGLCERACPEGLRTKDGNWKCDNSACTACGACVRVCPVKANKINGSYMTAEEVLEATIKDQVFYKKSNGGVTISGGEPLMQEEFLYQLAKEHADAGISLVLETCGFGSWAALERILPYVSLFLYDWKMTNSEAHKRLTGVGNELIRQNLSRLDEAGARVLLRCPVIPGCNDVKEHFEGIGKLAEEMHCIEQVEILPYHSLGNYKRKKMGLEEDGLTTPSKELGEQWKAMVQKNCRVLVK